MGHEGKTPQQKKELAVKKDHFVRAEHPHAFRKNWPRKKARTNRDYRRKTEEILSQAKRAITSEDSEIVAGELTAAHIKQSVSRKRLRKSGKVSLAERISITQANRKRSIGKNVEKNRRLGNTVTAAVTTLGSLAGQQLEDTVIRIASLLQGGDPTEWHRLSRSRDPLDQAVYFVEQVEKWGDFNLINALRNDENARQAYAEWMRKAARMLKRLSRSRERKFEQKSAIEEKLKRMAAESEAD